MENTKKDIELRSEEVQDVLGAVSPSIVRWGITVVTIVIVVLLTGCFIFKYPDVVTGSVILTTQEPPANVLARATGKIDELYVKNNQLVQAGTPLAVIQNPANTSDIRLLTDRLKTWFEKKQDLNVAKILFDNQTFQLGSVQIAYTNFLGALREYLQFTELHYHSKRIDLQRQQVEEQRQNLAEMGRQGILMKQQLENSLSTYKRDSLLYRKGVLSDEDFDSAKNKLLQTRQSYSSLRTGIKQAEININTYQGSLLDLQQDFQQKDNTYMLNLRTTAEQLQTELKSWERNYLLVSPIKGVVNLMGYWSNNQNVDAGETVFSILPIVRSNPFGKALLPVQGSGKVRIGQKANVRLNNFPDQEFGYMEGIVRHISATPNKDGLYVVEIFFPKGMMTNYHRQLPITRQMEGSAEIITDDVRLIERFFNPIKKVLKKYS